MSKLEVNAIEPQCGTTLTLGASGDTVTLAAGASQSGFGRTGTVDWDTTAKTTSFTAVSGTGYFVNTTSGAITVTMPATPSAGDIVAIKDYAGTFSTNNVTLGRNSSNFEGAANNAVLVTNSISTTFIYVDATKGWVQTNDSTSTNVPEYITATGGTITTSGDYKIHTFTGPGTFCVSAVGNPLGSSTVDYLVIAGGGGGGSVRAGGGGAGGYRESSGTASGCYTVSPLGACVSALPVSVTGYPITVGAGGTAGSSPGNAAPPFTAGGQGGSSIFSTITSTGGGGGGTPEVVGANGGSGGGGVCSGANPGAAASGNTPPVSPPQGNNGGTGAGSPKYGAGGGGGATAAGAAGTTPGCGGDGGAGGTSSINATPTARAGGGGGAGYQVPAAQMGDGGAGGGGDAGGPGESGGSAGTANTGGGGGGGYHPGPGTEESGGAGGSGIVIIRYKYQ